MPQQITPPPAVRTSIALWLFAISAGAVETLLFVVQALATDGINIGLSAQAVVRLGIYTLLAVAVWRLKTGANWLRIAVAAVIGGFGTLSMVTSPITWLINGGSVLGFFAEATAWDIGFIALRAAHVTAVLAALAFMFTSESHRFFTARRRLREDTISAKAL